MPCDRDFIADGKRSRNGRTTRKTTRVEIIIHVKPAHAAPCTLNFCFFFFRFRPLGDDFSSGRTVFSQSRPRADNNIFIQFMIYVSLRIT